MAEPILLLGKQRFSNVDIRIRVKGGGHVSQIYAIRQAIAKALVAFYQKCARRSSARTYRAQTFQRKRSYGSHLWLFLNVSRSHGSPCQMRVIPL